MRSFGSRKAPDPDGFKPIVLKNLNEKAVIFMTELYKMSISTQQILVHGGKWMLYSYLNQGKRIIHPQIHTGHNSPILCIEGIGASKCICKEVATKYFLPRDSKLNIFWLGFPN